MKKLFQITIITTTMLMFLGCSTTPTPQTNSNTLSLTKEVVHTTQPKKLQYQVQSTLNDLGWSIVATDSIDNQLILQAQKEFTYKSKYFNHSAYRGTRKVMRDNVSISLLLSSNELQLTTKTEIVEKIEEQVMSDLKEMENRIVSMIASEV